MVRLSFSSSLAATADEVWTHATGMNGVNYELLPLIRMTVPRRAREMRIDDAPLGEPAFRSLILAGSLIPIDLHWLTIAELGPGKRFLERSPTALQRCWQHERSVEPDSQGGCVLSDRLAIEPRVRLAEPMVGMIVGAIFRHRHRRLQARFGAGS